MAQNTGLVVGVVGSVLAVGGLLNWAKPNFAKHGTKKDRKKGRSSDENLSRSGLPNLGNTCFVNCMLQALRSCQSFRSYIRDVSHLRGSDLFVRRFIECVEAEGKPKPGTLRGFLTELKGEIALYRGFRQHDAHELFNYLLEILESKVHKSASIPNLMNVFSSAAVDEQKSLPEDVRSPFEGLVASFLRCAKCRKWSAVQHEKFNSISLPVPMYEEGLQLCDLLDDYTKSEQLEGVNCDICSAKKTLRYVRKELEKTESDIQERERNLSSEAVTNDEETQRLYERKSDLGVQEVVLQHHVQNGIDPTDDEYSPSISESNRIKPKKVSNIANKQYLFARLPTALCFHINRLLGEGKNDANILFPEILNLREYVADATKKYSSSFSHNHRKQRARRFSASLVDNSGPDNLASSSSVNASPSPPNTSPSQINGSHSPPNGSSSLSSLSSSSLSSSSELPPSIDPLDSLFDASFHPLSNGDLSESLSHANSRGENSTLSDFDHNLGRRRLVELHLNGITTRASESDSGGDQTNVAQNSETRADFAVIEEKETALPNMLNGCFPDTDDDRSKSQNQSVTANVQISPNSPKRTKHSGVEVQHNSLSSPTGSSFVNSHNDSNSACPVENQRNRDIFAGREQTNPEYGLFAVVVHSGKSGNGHFTTYRKKLQHERGDGWVRCSDNHVEGVSIDEVKRCEAYILFYELLVKPFR